MKDAPKKLFMLTLALAILYSAFHFVSLKGLPPSWVHALEGSSDKLNWIYTPSSELIKPRSDLSALQGSQRKQQQAIQELSRRLSDMQKRSEQAAEELAVARKEKNNAAVLQMMQTQADSEQEEIKRYKDLVDELNKEKREEANKKTKPMPIIVSAVLGLAALFMLLSKKYSDEHNKWAVATLTGIFAFWLGAA